MIEGVFGKKADLILKDNRFAVFDAFEALESLELSANIDLELLRDTLKHFTIFLNGPEHAQIKKYQSEFYTRGMVEDYRDKQKVKLGIFFQNINGKVDLLKQVIWPVIFDLTRDLIGLKNFNDDYLHFLRNKTFILFNELPRLKQISDLQEAVKDFHKKMDTIDPIQGTYFKYLKDHGNKLSDHEIYSILLSNFIGTFALALTLANIIVASSKGEYSIKSILNSKYKRKILLDLINLNSSIIHTLRVAKEDVYIYDQLYKKNSIIRVQLQSKKLISRNIFGNADCIQKTENKLLAFSSGAHRCPGSNLSLSIIEEVLNAIITKNPDIRIDSKQATHYKNHTYIANDAIKDSLNFLIEV